MTDFLEEEQIYRIKEREPIPLQEKIEGIDTVVLINKTLSEYSDSAGASLKKLIQVVGKENSAEIINHSEQPFTLNQILRSYSPKYIFTFGLNPKKLGLDISTSLNQIVQMESERIIFCEELSFLDDAAKKKAIWPVLQRFFELV